MTTVLMNRCNLAVAGKTFSRKRRGLRILVLLGLGAMVLTIFCILPGCGSESDTGGSVKGKNAATATKSGTMKPHARSSLLLDQEETGAGKMALPKKQFDSKNIEVFPGAGITQAELEAKRAADRAQFAPKSMEAYPGAGITQAELEAKRAADRAQFDPKSMEVYPGAGITQAELEARRAADRAQFDPRSMEAPGVK